MSYRVRVLLLLFLAVTAAAWLFSRPRDAYRQDPCFHCFADDRTLLSVPNCLNVLSNIPFLAVGLLGVAFLVSPAGRRRGGPADEPMIRLAYLIFFIGVGLTAFGSGYYHLLPNYDRLMWDRLPMSVAFTSLFAAIIMERVGLRVGSMLLWPLLTAGVWSVLYWHKVDDLRPYYFVQFFPLLALPLLLSLFPPMYTRGSDIIVAILWYVVAKFCENPLDLPIYARGYLVSGHTLKHLAAALGTYQILRMIMHRVRVDTSSLQPA